jgi:hypothetical protein
MGSCSGGSSAISGAAKGSLARCASQ